MVSYATKTNRKRLANAYSDKSPLVQVLHLPEEQELVLYSNDGRALIFASAQLAEKSTRSTQGVQVLNLRKNRLLERACTLEEAKLTNQSRYRAKTIPSSGAILRPEDAEQAQVTMDTLAAEG